MFELVDAEKAHYPIQILCEVLEVSRSGFYAWRSRPTSARKTGDWSINAVAESFFATLRAELVDDERYPTRRAAEASIGDDIDGFYNTERLHSHLDYVSPIEFELKDHLAAIAA